MENRQALLGFLAIGASSLLLAVSSISVKLLSPDFSGAFISLFRFLSGLVLGAGVLLFSREWKKPASLPVLLGRGFFGSIAMVLFFISIGNIGSGKATLLLQLYPLFIFLISTFFLKERTSFLALISTFVCIAGVAAVARDISITTVSGLIIGLVAAFVRGIATIFIRLSAQKNNVVHVYLSVCIFGLVLLPFTYHEFSAVNLHVLPLLILNGVVTFLAQMLLAYGLRHVSSMNGSIMTYLTIPFTVLLSFFVGEHLTPAYAVGILLILFGLYLNVLSLQRKKAPQGEAAN